MNKLPGPIIKVVANSPVFHSEVIQPTLINCFYGKNGTGKSTLAKLIGKDSTEWQSKYSKDEYELLIYNEDFIQENIQSYGNISGVFTITKANAEAKAQIDLKNDQLKQKEIEYNKNRNSLNDNKNQRSKLRKDLEEKVWKLTDSIRRRYAKTQKGFGSSKAKFVDELLKYKGEAVDEESLKKLYELAYGEDVPRYSQLQLVDTTPIPSSLLISKAIVSSGSTEFADFVKAIKATDWLSQGHQEFQNMAGGKCPYCQQALPSDFEDKLASCFDEQYKQDVKAYKAFSDRYKAKVQTLRETIEENTKSDFSCDELQLYKKNFDIFTERVKYNETQLDDKAKNISKIIELSGLQDLIENLNNFTEKINEKIRQHNEVLDNKPKTQSECKQLVWKLLANVCQTEIDLYLAADSDFNNKLKELQAEEDKLLNEINQLRTEVGSLSKQTVNTTEAKNRINHLIKASGFQGFYLEEKPGTQFVYQLVREDKSIAKGLSEGERHFIAFLYFYHLVIGSQSEDGVRKNKIVVIDDPVSSMDSTALFTVSTLVREIIAICFNNYELSENNNKQNYIKQFFCMTHNPFFFREIIYNRLSHYECVSVFEIKKQERNRSTIMLCEEEGPRVGDGKINCTPIINTYESLWREFRRSQNPVELLSVTRQILEYYFLQMCGYTNGNIRGLLEENKARFIEVQPDGTMDSTRYELVHAMAAMLDVGALGFNDGLYFDATSIDSKVLKDTFKQVFEIMGQLQHYRMMMSESIA